MAWLQRIEFSAVLVLRRVSILVINRVSLQAGTFESHMRVAKSNAMQQKESGEEVPGK